MPVSQLYFPYYFWFFQSVARKHKSRSFFDLCWLIHHYIFRTSEFESANNSNQISSFFFNFSRLIAFKCGQYLKRIWIEVRSIRDLLVYFNEYDDDCWSSLILIVHLSQSDKSHQSISRWWTSIIRFWDFSFCFASQSKAIIHHPRLVIKTTSFMMTMMGYEIGIGKQSSVSLISIKKMTSNQIWFYCRRFQCRWDQNLQYSNRSFISEKHRKREGERDRERER